jgi:putative ABC transport system substrate-binding protein
MMAETASVQAAARTVTLALAAKLPAIYGGRDYVDAGGLISYGPDLVDNYRRAANFVDKILRGTNPANISPSSNRPNFCSLLI